MICSGEQRPSSYKRAKIRRDGTTGLTLFSLSLSFSFLTSATERQEETKAAGTLIVLTCRFGWLFESTGVVAFRNAYGPRYGRVSRRYGIAMATPWLSSRKRIESVNEINARVAISWV